MPLFPLSPTQQGAAGANALFMTLAQGVWQDENSKSKYNLPLDR